MNTEKIITELSPIDYLIEYKKITLLFNNNKILILSDFKNKIMFTFFSNRMLISAKIARESKVIRNFKKYLETES
jgi:hypothetical protein